MSCAVPAGMLPMRSSVAGLMTTSCSPLAGGTALPACVHWLRCWHHMTARTGAHARTPPTRTFAGAVVGRKAGVARKHRTWHNIMSSTLCCVLLTCPAVGCAQPLLQATGTPTGTPTSCRQPAASRRDAAPKGKTSRGTAENEPDRADFAPPMNKLTCGIDIGQKAKRRGSSKRAHQATAVTV
jgi:hypothetical protein